MVDCKKLISLFFRQEKENPEKTQRKRMMENSENTNQHRPPFTLAGGDGVGVHGGMEGWNQVLPSVMPWSSGGTNMPQVLRFTAQDHNYGFVQDNRETRPKPSLLIPKRKCPIDLEAPPPKMHITDEQMATRMKGLHISHADSSFNRARMSASSSPIDDSDMSLPSLIMCDEIRQLRMPDNILPPELIARLERPSKALVVWKPPELRVAELQRIALNTEENKNDEQPSSSSSYSRVQAPANRPAYNFFSMDTFNNNNNDTLFSVPQTSQPSCSETNDVEEMALDDV